MTQTDPMPREAFIDGLTAAVAFNDAVPYSRPLTAEQRAHFKAVTARADDLIGELMRGVVPRQVGAVEVLLHNSAVGSELGDWPTELRAASDDLYPYLALRAVFGTLRPDPYAMVNLNPRLHDLMQRAEAILLKTWHQRDAALEMARAEDGTRLP